MNSLVNMNARFLPMRKFRSRRKARTRAFLTAGYPRQGDGSFYRRSIKLRHTINRAHEVECVDFFANSLFHLSAAVLTDESWLKSQMVWDCILFEEEKKKSEDKREQLQAPSPEIPYWQENENK